jgi:hypothetical protein
MTSTEDGTSASRDRGRVDDQVRVCSEQAGRTRSVPVLSAPPIESSSLRVMSTSIAIGRHGCRRAG